MSHMTQDNCKIFCEKEEALFFPLFFPLRPPTVEMAGWARGFFGVSNITRDVESLNMDAPVYLERNSSALDERGAAFLKPSPRPAAKPMIALHKSTARVMSEKALCGCIAEYLIHFDAVKLEGVTSAMSLHDDYFAKAYSRELTKRCGGQCTWRVKVWETSSKQEADLSEWGERGELARRRTASTAAVLIPAKRREVYAVYRQVASALPVCQNNSHASGFGTKPSITSFHEIRMRVTGVSSQDRDEEGPTSLLRDSACQRIMDGRADFSRMSTARKEVYAIECQLRCGCVERNPCYWSSSPCRHQNLQEWIDFEVEPARDPTLGIIFNNGEPSKNNTLCLLSHIKVRAYRAWAQPEFPVYAPTELQIELIAPTSDGGEVIYYTESFSYQHSDKEQTFVLQSPVPVFPQHLRRRVDLQQRLNPEFSFRNGLAYGNAPKAVAPKIRIRCNGAYQRQTVSAEDIILGEHNYDTIEDLNGYFICLSRVAFYGAGIHNVDSGANPHGYPRPNVLKAAVWGQSASSALSLSPPTSPRGGEGALENPPYAYVKDTDTAVHADAKAEAVFVAEAGSGVEKEVDSGHVHMQLDWYLSTPSNPADV